MKITSRLLLFFLSATLLTACGDDENDYIIGGSYVKPSDTGNQSGSQDNGNDGSNTSTDVASVIKRLEFPKTRDTNGSFVIVHNALLNAKTGERGVNYCVEWDPTLHAQRWCCYQMYGKVENGVMQGTRGEFTDRYYADNDGSLSIYCQYPNDTCVAEKYRFTKDPFKSSGFDHGHICPSADRLGSAEANYQTFFMTNMMPQVNGFNSKIWATMETQVRTWAGKFDTLYVCKGGTIDKAENIVKYLGSGDNKIPVPKYFFMALLGRKGADYSALGFWINSNSNSSNDIRPYVVNIGTLEKNTDIDFFCNLSDDIEGTIENQSVETIKAYWGLK